MATKSFAKKFLIAALSAGFVVGCALQPSEESKTRPLISAEDRQTQERLVPDSYLRVYNASKDIVSKPVKLKDASISTVFDAAVPGYALMPQDSAVKLDSLVTVNTDPMPLTKFLQVMTTASNYDFRLAGKNIEVRSQITKQWSLPAFSGKQQSVSTVVGNSSSSSTSQSGGYGSDSAGASFSNGGGSSSSGTRGSKTVMTNSFDEWDSLVAYIKSVAGKGADVFANRYQSYVSVTAAPDKIAAVGKIISHLNSTSSKLIRLDVKAYEVTLNDTRAKGINWNALWQAAFNSGADALKVSLGGAFATSTTITGGLTAGINGNSGNDTGSAVLNFLSQYGTVEIKTEPMSVTVNGRTAQFGSGDEFGYVASITQTASTLTSTGTSANVQRILIGVELSVTPKLLDDGRILLEIVPIISTFRGFDNFTISGNTFSQPRIALSQLATTAIARSGQPIPLGGLISTNLASTINKLPVDEKATLGIVNGLVEGVTNSVQRKELLITVTPSLIGT